MCNYPMYVQKELQEPQLVPCGMCTSCRIEKSRQWAVRIMHEASLNEVNSFVTLTYNNKNLPKDGSLRREDLQYFVRTLRRKLKGRKVRYYGVGEYGDNFDRPHYHIILFGVDFKNKEAIRISKSRTGKINNLYISHYLEDEVWKKGYVKVGAVSFDSASYVARYVIKKVNGERALKHYKGKKPEFALMSRRPGIGRGWIEKYKGDVYPKDYFHINGVKSRAPRYYDEYLKKQDILTHEQIKIKRKEKQERVHPVRREQKEKYLILLQRMKKRRLENAK